MNLNVICLEDEAFKALIKEIKAEIAAHVQIKDDRWISDIEAMKKLRITSRSTLQRLRDEGKIEFSHPERKMIYYDSKSIDEFLEKNRKKPFS